MFIFILVAVALADYIITFYCILNMVAQQDVEPDEAPIYLLREDKTINNADMGFVCDDNEFESYVKNFISYDKELNGYDKYINTFIEEQNSRIALLSSNVDKILSNIELIIREKREDSKQQG